MMHGLLPTVFSAIIVAVVKATPVFNCHDSNNPAVTIANGTYAGVHLAHYRQDEFLGIPFAQAPIGPLRFHNPVSLNSTWIGSHDAKKLSASCVGYGPSQIGYVTDEDCLYLNIWRPSGYENVKLPVAVWIHGGGYVQGSGSDLRYNLSYIVNQSQRIDEPIIALSLNYRLSAWGFLNSEEFFNGGSSNMGYRDQRMALEWIKENIAAFGGDSDKITLWGQSAGAASVGAQLLAYNGRDDGLFHQAIMESGATLALSSLGDLAESSWSLLLRRTGCNISSGSINCLRDIPFEDLNAIINTTELSGGWHPKIDNDIIMRESSLQLADTSFVKVPIIIGENTDEGTTFAPKGIDTKEQFKNTLLQGMNSSFADNIVNVYTEESIEPILPNQASDWIPPPSAGALYRSTTAYFGDQAMIAPRRLTAYTWAKNHIPVWSYRFNAIPAWATYLDGATHFAEVAFSMRNLNGVGYPPIRVNPFEGLTESYQDLARLMSSDWVHFVATGNPNGWRGREDAAKSLGEAVPLWPPYLVENEWHSGKNFVYEGNISSYVEDDSYRLKAIDLIISGSLDVYGR